MFLRSYLGFLLSAIVLWFIIVRITKDEQGLDWWDVLLWMLLSYLASAAAAALILTAGLPEVLALFIALLAGAAVLGWLLKRQYGGEKASHIIVAYVVVRLLFALPRLFDVWDRMLATYE